MSQSLRNSAGKPLSDSRWLDVHHRAKITERTAFAHRIAQMGPERIVDLGCGTGQWLSLLDETIAGDCELIGLDVDPASIDHARLKSSNWRHPSRFIRGDFMDEPSLIPPSDLTLLFNMITYAEEPEKLLSDIHSISPSGIVLLRQYDGATIRFGPIAESQRLAIDGSLRASLSSSAQFDHYALDRAFEAIRSSPYPNRHIDFELFYRIAPYSEEVRDYLDLTIDWIQKYVSETSRASLLKWRFENGLSCETASSYIYEVDLVVELS